MPWKDKERRRAYAQRPENKERQRAYAQRPENKERQRAYKRDLARLMKRLELDGSGVEAILSDARNGRRYIDIAVDWLIKEVDVSDLALAHGIARRPRRAQVAVGASP